LGEGIEEALGKRLKRFGTIDYHAHARWDVLFHNIFRKHVKGFCNIVAIPKIHPLLANSCATALRSICPNMGTHQHHRYTHNRHGYCPLHVVTSLW